MKEEIQFAVTSKRFSLYEAFRTEVEKFGWKWNEKFIVFAQDTTKNRNSLFFSTKWYKDGVPMFAFSNSGGDTKSFDLGSEFEAALAYAASLIEKKITYEDVTKSFKSPVPYITAPLPNDGMANKFLAMIQLANVAEYLNPEHKKAVFSFYINGSGDLGWCNNGYAHGQPRFASHDDVKKAIEILGETTIKTAIQ